MYKVDFYEERGEASITVSTRSGATVWSCFDQDEIQSLIEDGFIKWGHRETVIGMLTDLGVIGMAAEYIDICDLGFGDLEEGVMVEMSHVYDDGSKKHIAYVIPAVAGWPEPLGTWDFNGVDVVVPGAYQRMDFEDYSESSIGFDSIPPLILEVIHANRNH